MKVCQACGKGFDTLEWRCSSCGWIPVSRDGFTYFAPDLDGVDGDYGAELHECLVKHESSNFWFSARNKLIMWALGHYFPESRNFLEMGCGTGFVLSQIQQSFPNIKLCGGDLFSKGLVFTRSKVPNANLLQIDGRKMPFDGEFDAIGAFDILEHIDEDELVLSNMHRALKSGGGILITVPQHPFLWSQWDEIAFHKRRYTQGELVEKIRRAGFEPLKITSFMFFPFPLMILRRAIQKRSPAQDPLADLNVPKWGNYIMANIMSVERYLIKIGISFPVGGSLFIVAKRR